MSGTSIIAKFSMSLRIELQAPVPRALTLNHDRTVFIGSSILRFIIYSYSSMEKPVC